MNFNNLKSLQN